LAPAWNFFFNPPSLYPNISPLCSYELLPLEYSMGLGASEYANWGIDSQKNPV
jgi:hypothetical protein